MRPLLLLAATAVLLTACSDDDDEPTGPPAEIAGSYDLVSVNAAALPQTATIQGADVTFFSGNITLAADGTCSNRLEILVEEEGEEPVEDNTTYECTYRVDGSLVTTTDDIDGFTAQASWSGDELTWVFPGATLVFER